MAIFKGSGVALVTPFNEDKTVNYEKLDELVEFQIESGTDAIISCGTTGESATLDIDEHVEVIKRTVKAVSGRIPVIAGTGSNATHTAVELTMEAEKLGADAALVVTPYYNKATQKGLIEHYSAIADSTSLPIIVYNVPSRTGVNVLPETMVKLARLKKNIVAIKEASGNISQVAKLAALAAEDNCVDIYSGNDDQVIPLMALGGLGVISVFANICPKETHDLAQAYLDGDIEKAKKMQFDALELMNALFIEVNPIPVKCAMNLMGMEAGPLRGPLCEMEEANLEKLKRAMASYGLMLK